MQHPSAPINHDTLLPFLKWAGGKRWFTENYGHLLPKNFNKYVEPFLGSGAVYFYLQPETAILSDINRDLITTYTVLRDTPCELRALLQKYHNKHNYDFYYLMREYSPRKPLYIAARFIYLNRTCFNAIWRVNRKGKFNVPKGSKDSVILPTDNFEKISELLKSSHLFYNDYKTIIEKAGRGDFVFIDPPYTIKHNENGFVKYNETLFTWDDQVSLKNAVDKATERGAHVMVLNADHPSITKLYPEYRKTKLNRSSVIAAHSPHRGKFNELCITSW